MKTIVNLLLIFILLSTFSLYSQTDAGVKVMPVEGDLYKEVKKLNNPYALPLWGKKLGERGFLLPYPIGIMLNGYVGSQDVTISDLNVGINDANGNVVIPTTSLDNVVGFNDVKASVQNFNIRTDIWALPFLDVYGLFGKAWVETKVGIGSVINNPVDISTQANFNGYVYGIGGMLTGGIHSSFFSLDVNKVWTHFDELKNDNTAVNMGLRGGYVFHFIGKPERNVSLWTGAGRVFLNNHTIGTIPLSEIAPDITKGDWYNDLPNKIKSLVDRVVENHSGDAINYSLNKKPTHNWSMILGAQFQLDRHWQFRTETNFFGGRSSGLISANYRFGFF